MSSFAKRQVDNVLCVRSDNSEGKALPFEIGEHWSTKKELKMSLFCESQQYIYHHEIEKEYKEFSFRLAIFSRVTNSTYC